MAKVPEIRQTYFYRATPAEVYAALTQPAQLLKWFANGAKIDAKKGGRYHLAFSGGYEMKGKVKRAKAAARLTVTWVDKFGKGKTFKTSADFVLRKKNGGTILKLTHEGFGSGKQWVGLYGAIQSGWAYYLTNLRSVLEHGTDLRSEHDAVSGG